VANTLKLEIIVDDQGTPIIQKFADGTSSALDKVESASSSMGGGFEKTWAGITTGAGAAIYAFKELAGIVQAPIEAYMESEKALLKMGMAMKNQGDFSRDGLAAMEEFAAQIQKTTAYEDDATLAIMGNLKSFGMTNEEVKRATQTALDYTAAKANEGMTVEKASEILGKAYLGQTTGLKKLGIQVEETAHGAEVFDAVVGQLNARFGGSSQAELLTYAGQWKQLKNQWGDIQEFLGLVFLKTIEGVGFGISMMGAGFWKTVETMLNGLGLLSEGMQKFSSFIGMENVSNGIGVITDALKAGALNAKEAADAAIVNASANYDNMVSFDKVTTAIDAMGIAGKRTMAIDEEAAKQAKKNADELKKMEEASLKAYLKGIDDEIDANEKFLQDEAKAQTEYWKGIDKLQDDSLKAYLKSIDDEIEANDKALTEIAKDNVKAYDDEKGRLEKLGDAYRQLYKDVKGYEGDYYELSLKSLDAQADKYRAVGVAQEDVDKWRKEEGVKAWISYKKSSDDFFGGVEAGFIEMTKGQTTWGSTGYDTIKKFSDDSASAFGTNFKDIIKGDFEKIGNAWEGVWDGALTVFSNDLGKMVTAAVEKTVVMTFQAAVSGDWTQVLGLLNKGWDLVNGLTGGGAGSVDSGGGDWMANAGGYGGHADGGPVAPGTPVWVGEKGPELLFPGGPGYVMEHNQSISYAAKNGGFIPGFADGGYIGSPIRDLPYDVQNRLMWQYPLYTSSTFAGDVFTGGTINPKAAEGGWYRAGDGNWYHDFWTSRQGQEGGPIEWLNNSVRGLNVGDSLNKGSDWLSGIINTIGQGGLEIGRAIYPYVMTAIGTAVGNAPGGAFMGAIGGLASTGKPGGMLAGGIGGYFAGSTWMDVLKNAATSEAKRAVMDLIVSQLLGGGTGDASISFTNMNDNGLMASLASSMSSIAPKSTPFDLPIYHNGIDYVPRTGPAILEKGERVTSKGQNSGYDGGMVINSPLIVIEGNLVADRATFNEFVDKIDYVLTKKRRREIN
jgi:hypothetical protein